MKSLAVALAFILPSAALAQSTAGSREAMCYSYYSQTPASAFKLLKPEIQAFLNDQEVPKGQRPRVVACIQGLLATLVSSARSECLVGGDPGYLAEAAFSGDVFACVEESGAPPSALFPEAAVLPEGAPPAARRRGLRPR